jgi:hypothetical protein
LSNSQWGDPVNYFFPIPDKGHAETARLEFTKIRETYDLRSRSIVRSRLNRLLRKYEVDPIEKFNPNDEPDAFSDTDRSIGGVIKLQEGEEGESKNVVIDAARVATFQHPWYGPMLLDDDFYESLIDNWQTNVVGRQLSLDAEHTQGPLGGMSLAWFTNVALENDILRITTEPTPTGEQYLGSEYRYASIAFRDNYIDQETGIDYGPTLDGCAATNYPFIHRNNPINNQQMFQVPMWYSGSSPEMTAGTNNGSFIWTPFVNDKIGEIEMPTEKVVDEKVDAKKVDDKKVDANGSEKKAGPIVAQSLQLPDGTVLNASDVQRLMETNERTLSSLKAERIERHCNEALERGVPPALVNISRQILEHCNPNADETIQLSLGDDKQMQANYFSAIVELLETCPARLGEVSYTKTESNSSAEDGEEKPGKPEDELTLEQAEEQARLYRKENSPAYERASLVDVEL